MNEVIKAEIKLNRLFNYEVAAKIGISEYTFCKWFRKELTTEQIDKIHKAIEAAKEAAQSKRWGGKIPANLKLPLHDGDTERADDENYEGMMYFNASSKDAPQIVDRKVQPILDPMECGSGDYCNVSVNFYGFSMNGNRGVAAGLQNIQLVKHGERLAAFGG